MKMKLDDDSGSSVKFFIAIVGLTVIGIVLKELSNIFIPFVIAYFLYFVFAPLNLRLKRIKIPLFAIIILNIAITFLFSWGISKIIIDSFLSLAKVCRFMKAN